MSAYTNEDAGLDLFMEDRIGGGLLEEPEPFWMDDLYQYNLDEADDYRDEGMEDFDGSYED